MKLLTIMPPRHGSRRAGFTVLEVTIAATIFAVLGYVLLRSSEMGHDSHEAVANMIDRSANLRAGRSEITNDLMTASGDSITVTTLADGNHSLTFMMPISVGGVNTWGVYDRSLGSTEDEQNKEDWSLRFTVEEYVIDGEESHGLVRQILDDAGDIQKEELVIQGVHSGGATPGFSVVQTGDLWEVQINQVGHGEDSTGQGTSFYVLVRN